MKNQERDTVKVSELTMGHYSYYFLQRKDNVECHYDLLEQDELMQFIELNYDGSKDDREPRRLLELDSKLLSKMKTATHIVSFSAKVCMNAKGEVVAYRYINATSDEASTIEKLEPKDFLSIRFESRTAGSCVECKEQYFWITSAK